MKAMNMVCRVLTAVFGVGALVLFFLNFVQVTTGGELIDLTGSQLAFGGSIETAAGTVKLAKSAHLFLCFFLTAVAAVTALLGFRFKKSRIAAPIFGLGAGIYMLVISLARPAGFVDFRPLSDVTYLSYFLNIYLCMGCLLLCALAGFAALLIADYMAVQESGGAKKTIPQRVAQFFREYKSEIKKIVWPGPKSVVKNTLVVLIICLIVGAFIWLLDFGLGKLLELILQI